MPSKNPIPTRDSLVYEGVNVLVPVGGWQFVKAKRDPTTNDKKYPVGTIWLNTVLQNIWMQTQAAGVWQQIESAGSGGVLAVANGGTGVATLAAHGVVVGEGTSAVAVVGPGAVGTVLAGNGASADPSFQTIPSLNVVDNTTGTVASPTAMTVNTTYIADQAAATTGFKLPASATIGQEISIAGNGPGGWQIQQNASQQIVMNGNATTVGTGGSLSSTNRYNAVTLVAVVAGASTIWAVNDFSGSFTFV